MDATFCPVCGRQLVETTIESKKRKVCPEKSCGYVHWDPPVPVVAAIVEHERKIVLARNKAWPQKMYGLITGFLEQEESPEEAVLREVMEELGLSGRSARLIGLYPFAAMNQLIIAYHVPAEGTIELGAELAEIKCLEPGKVKPWDFGTGPAVRDWLQTI